jgi:hypothetical protein
MVDIPLSLGVIYHLPPLIAGFSQIVYYQNDKIYLNKL